jgi:hypothetical protein
MRPDTEAVGAEKAEPEKVEPAELMVSRPTKV